MTKEEMDSKRTRKFNFELYPDNAEHAKAFEIIQNGEIGYIKRFVGILHDCDTYEETTPEHKEGDKKKSHYHLCVECMDAKNRVTLANKLGIEPRFIEPCEKWKGSLMYLIHYNIDKYQYEVERLFGDSDLIKYICNIANYDNKYIQFYKINEYIRNYDGIINIAEFNCYCIKNGWSYALKQYQILINSALYQHNKLYR